MTRNALTKNLQSFKGENLKQGMHIMQHTFGQWHNFHNFKAKCQSHLVCLILNPSRWCTEAKL